MEEKKFLFLLSISMFMLLLHKVGLIDFLSALLGVTICYAGWEFLLADSEMGIFCCFWPPPVLRFITDIILFLINLHKNKRFINIEISSQNAYFDSNWKNYNSFDAKFQKNKIFICWSSCISIDNIS